MSDIDEDYAAAEDAYLEWASNPHGFTGEILVYNCQNCGDEISSEDLEGFGSSGLCSACIEVISSAASCTGCGWVGSGASDGSEFCPHCGTVLGAV